LIMGSVTHLAGALHLGEALDLTPLEELTSELALARARIMRTDALIDRIVYILYGLTEEEIGIVDGGA